MVSAVREALGPSYESQGTGNVRRNVQGAPGRPRGPGRTGRASGRRSQPQSIPEPPCSGVQNEPEAPLPGTLAQEGRGWVATRSWD